MLRSSWRLPEAPSTARKAKSSRSRKAPEVSQSGSSTKMMLSSGQAFAAFAIVNSLAALFAPIQDCDEVFNYWEPTHYLSHGYGLQTWEYSPVYAIRSWLYVSLHAVIGRLGYALSLNSSKQIEFYFTRLFLGLLCAYCQTRMHRSVSRSLNPRVGLVFSAVMITSPGMFHAVAAYLPSSFSMYAAMLGAAEFIDWRGGTKTATGIMFFGIGGLLGWPFAAALVLPFLANELVMTYITKEWIELIRQAVDGSVRCTIFLTLQVTIDAFFYRKAAVVPWNIVAYNVFSGAGKGPEIFGTEPYDFYVKNLILNFNIWSLLALAALPLLGIQYITGSHTSAYGLMKNIMFTTPFVMWFVIFSLQPHKEERFMYPAYPFLALNASIALHVILTWLGNANPRTLVGMIPAKLKLLAVALTVVLAFNIGVLRTIAMVSAYRAPLLVYPYLNTEINLSQETSLCIGKEWYRFPSSYFLPDGVHAKFIKSEFKGLLPGEFSEAKTGFGFFPGAWLVPSGMNDANIEDLSKYVHNALNSVVNSANKVQIDISHCDYLVDVSFADSKPSRLEPDYAKDTSTWDTIHCEPFLDSSNTALPARIFWLPDLGNLLPKNLRRRWGDYCLLRRRRSA